MSRTLRTWLAGVALPTVAGCASFEGVPAPVHRPGYVVALANEGPFGFDAALQQATKADDAAKRNYRDAFIAIQVAAIDARYGEFRAKLSRQAKLANFGLDLGVLALTTGGAVAAERTANLLSAGGAGLTGAKGSLNKEVYFEKTLPALLVSMDARRIVLKAQIIEKMRRDIADYSIGEAIADLSTYQASASLDSAIGAITASAVETKKAAEETYDDVAGSCTPERGVADDWRRLRAGLDALSDEATLDKVSAVLGTDSTPPFARQKRLILRRVGEDYCTRAGVQALMTRITTMTGVSF